MALAEFPGESVTTTVSLSVIRADQMAKQSIQPTLYKSVFQVNFKPKLKFQPIIYTHLDDIEQDYGDWQTDGSTTALSNYERRCSLVVRLDLVQFNQDSSDLESETKGIGHVVEIVRNRFGLTGLQRIALRRFYLLPVESLDFASLIAIMNVKLLSQETALRQCLPGTIRDLLYRLDVREGSRQYNLMHGAVKREEVPKYLPFHAANHLLPENRDRELAKVLAGYPALSLIFDIDYFQNDPRPKIDEIDDFVIASTQRTQEVALSMGKYLLG